jgi:hypothetical protein
MLVSLGGCEPRAMGHVAANLNVGNGREVVLAVAAQLLPFIGCPRTLNALAQPSRRYTSSSLRLPIATTRSTPPWTSKMMRYSPTVTREYS